MQKCYKSRFFRFVSAVFSDIKHDTQWFSWFGIKKDFESRNSSQQFSDLETNLILKIVMDWLVRKNARRKFASQFTPQLTRKVVQVSPWGEGALTKYHLKLCANLPLQLQDNFLRSSKCKTGGESRYPFRVASSRGKYYTNSKPSVLSVHPVDGRKNMFTTWLTVVCVGYDMKSDWLDRHQLHQLGNPLNSEFECIIV